MNESSATPKQYRQPIVLGVNYPELQDLEVKKILFFLMRVTRMELNRIKELITLLKKSGITEIEVQEEDKTTGNVTKIRVSNAQTQFINATAPQVIQESTSTPAKTTEFPSKEQPPQSHEHHVKSPMVGTVYLAASPGADNFVQIGQTVKIGDTLCLIEAMKMFNRIEADKAGIVKAILISNAQPVEFDQPLFVIE